NHNTNRRKYKRRKERLFRRLRLNADVLTAGVPVLHHSLLDFGCVVAGHGKILRRIWTYSGIISYRCRRRCNAARTKFGIDLLGFPVANDIVLPVAKSFFTYADTMVSRLDPIKRYPAVFTA